jgi:hypothetical protein
MTDTPSICRELGAMRGRLIDRLSRRIDAADMALLSSVDGALVAMRRYAIEEHEPATDCPWKDARAHAAECADGIALTFNSKGGRDEPSDHHQVVITPAHALIFLGELIDALTRHLIEVSGFVR